MSDNHKPCGEQSCDPCDVHECHEDHKCIDKLLKGITYHPFIIPGTTKTIAVALRTCGCVPCGTPLLAMGEYCVDDPCAFDAEYSIHQAIVDAKVQARIELWRIAQWGEQCCKDDDKVDITIIAKLCYDVLRLLNPLITKTWEELTDAERLSFIESVIQLQVTSGITLGGIGSIVIPNVPPLPGVPNLPVVPTIPGVPNLLGADTPTVTTTDGTSSSPSTNGTGSNKPGNRPSSGNRNKP